MPDPFPDDEFLQQVTEGLPDVLRFDRTDVGNAELLAHLHGKDLKFDPSLGWLVWNGKNWAPDHDKAVRFVISAAKWRYRRAPELDYDNAKRESAWALSSQQANRVMGCLTIARSLEEFAAPDWDSNPWLLGCANGVIDLRTGKLLRHLRQQYITHLSPVQFDLQAYAPRWCRFIDEVFPDVEMRGFVQRAIGYSLTGVTTEQSFFLCFGKGANGKSKMLFAVKEILGAHAHTSSFSTFERSNQKEVPNDVAALKGKRFVIASEAKDATLIDEARIKALTGDDDIAARHLHQAWFSFRPVLKLWLSVNHRPIIDDDSMGMWRRMKLIPFTQTFDPTKDTDLEDQFRNELPGILAWAVFGCLDWLEQGLNPPETVKLAVEDYRQDSDTLTGFLMEACMISPGAEIWASDLYQNYRKWAFAAGYSNRETLTLTLFGRKMAERFKKHRTKQGVIYFGIKIA